MWIEFAVGETQSANRAARILVLAMFVIMAWLVGHVARGRRHPHRRLIAILGFALAAGLVVYILALRPVERWTIWAIAGLGYGILLTWAYGGGSEPKSD